MNENPKVIQQLLGHRDVKTTANIYSHLDYSNKLNSANTISDVFEFAKQEAKQEQTQKEIELEKELEELRQKLAKQEELDEEYEQWRRERERKRKDKDFEM